MNVAVRGVYRRCLRASAFCVPSHRATTAQYVRQRFRDALPQHNLTTQLQEAEAELQKMLTMLQQQGRVSADAAMKLRADYVPALHQAVSPSKGSVQQAGHAADAAVAAWDADAVGEWLTHHGFERHAPAFCDARVDGRLLVLLDDADLLELGVSSRVERKRILLECDALRGSHER
jgi:hypothetical protein